MVFFRWSLKTK